MVGEDAWNGFVCNPGRSRGTIKVMHIATRSQLSRSTSTDVEGRTNPIVTHDYVVGLTDGEGCFYVQVRTSDRYRLGATVHLHFHIKMKAEDKPLLEKVKNTLDCGEVYFQPENRSNHCQCYRFSVSSHTDIIQKVIPFFQRHRLQSVSKVKNFDLFCQIADLIQQKKHLEQSGLDKIRNIKAQMNL